MKCENCEFICTDKDKLNNHKAQTHETEYEKQQSGPRKRVKFTFKCLKNQCDSTFVDNKKLDNHDVSQHDSVEAVPVDINKDENDSPPRKKGQSNNAEANFDLEMEIYGQNTSVFEQ